MWMLLDPFLMPTLFDACTCFIGLVPASWCGSEDGTGWDLRIVGGGGGFLLAVTSR